MQLAAYIRRTEAELAAAGVDNPSLDARLLAAHALHIDRAQLLSRSDRMLNPTEMRHIDVLVECRLRREPMSRILGEREFWSLTFGLNEATLVPRPDSEILIETALKKLPENQPLSILDLGTGSGCLLLALLHELPNATGIGVDIATRAVEQANANAEKLGLAQRAKFKVNDWADAMTGPFDLIISNPPYIAKKEIATLMQEVRDYDPHMALDGGDDGLVAYRALAPQLPKLLKPQSWCVFEIGEGQGEQVRTIFAAAGLRDIETHHDLNGIERCMAARAT